MNVQTDKPGGDKKRAEGWVEVGAVELEYFFVRGMPMVISCKGKIGHEDWQVANGCRCIAHSFVHAESDGFIMPTDVWHPSSAGKVFKIDQPEVINVQLVSNDKSLGDIIPFRRKVSKEPMMAFLKHASPQTKQILKGPLVPSVLIHYVDQAFSFTYNKLQRATVDRLILVLNDLSKSRLGKMCIHKLYVAISRVRNGKHIAILEVSNEELQYLKKLSYSDKLLAWDKNYDDVGKWKTNDVLFLKMLKKHLMKYTEVED